MMRASLKLKSVDLASAEEEHCYTLNPNLNGSSVDLTCTYLELRHMRQTNKDVSYDLLHTQGEGGDESRHE